MPRREIFPLTRWQGWIQGVAGLDAGSGRAGFRGRAGFSLVATEQVLSALFGPSFGRFLVDLFCSFSGVHGHQALISPRCSRTTATVPQGPSETLPRPGKMVYPGFVEVLWCME